MTRLPPEKFVGLHPVRKELQLERVGLTAPGQVIVELYKGGDFCKTQIIFTWGMKLLMKKLL